MKIFDDFYKEHLEKQIYGIIQSAYDEGFQNGIGNTEIRYHFRKMNDVEKEYASDEKLAYKDGYMSALSDIINSIKDSNKSEISSQELLSGLEDWYLTKIVELEA